MPPPRSRTAKTPEFIAGQARTSHTPFLDAHFSAKFREIRERQCADSLTGITNGAAGSQIGTAAAPLAALKTSGLAGIKISGDIGDMGFTAAGSIGPTFAAAGIDNADILAGANLGNDGAIGGTCLAVDIFLRPASIASITTGGVFKNSIISAGIAAVNGTPGDADDILIRLR